MKASKQSVKPLQHMNGATQEVVTCGHSYLSCAAKPLQQVPGRRVAEDWNNKNRNSIPFKS